jgi:phage major head subunit gpT-like protein
MAKRKKPPEPQRMAKIECTASVDWIQAEEGKDGPKSFSLIGYTGGQMTVWAYYRPVVLDLQGLTTAAEEIPALLGHDPSQIVGHGTAEITARQVKLSGVISGGGDAAKEVLASSANGFPWKASVGVSPTKVEFVEVGASAQANGKTWKGPINIVRGGVLGEISFVPMAADSKTSVHIAASREEFEMDKKFKAWLEAKGFEPDTLTEAQTTTLKAAYDSEQTPTPPQEKPAELKARVSDEDPAEAIRAKMRTAAAEESQRIDAIRNVCQGQADIEAKAISEGWNRDQAELAVLRASRAKPPSGTSQNTADMAAVQAAFARSAGLKDFEKHFKPEVLEASDRYRGIGLQEILLIHARSAGYDGRQKITTGNVREVLKAAFSTHTLTTLLTSTGNKILLDGFMSMPQTWRQVAAVRTVNDFKTVTAFRLNASLEYEEVGPAGEMEHGTVSQESYTMQAKTYAKMLVLTRQDIINDDLGAFNDLRQRLGLGAAITMNKAFWTIWLNARNGAAFWTAARGNLVTSASLGEAGLTKAVKAFRDMAGPDGNRMNLEPEFVLVPTDLEFTARKLYVSQEMRDTTASTRTMTANIYQNKFTPIVVPELGSDAYTGYSATSWHLLANPAILASAAMCFLNGQQSPTIESADADFNTLGVQFRGYHDFGAQMTEYRASVEAQA